MFHSSVRAEIMVFQDSGRTSILETFSKMYKYITRIMEITRFVKLMIS